MLALIRRLREREWRDWAYWRGYRDGATEQRRHSSDGLTNEERMAAALAIRESTLNDAMGYEQRQYLYRVARKLDRLL